MAETLSAKLGLEPSGNVADPFDYSPAGVAAAIEDDRRATVEAVARWLEDRGRTQGKAWGTNMADAIRRELLSPSPGEGREPEASETWLLECPWPECRHRWESRFASLHYKSCPGCHNSLTFNGARVIRFPESEPEASDGE